MKLAQRLSYHNLFLVIGLFFGLKMVFVNPPWQTNDADRHFYNAYNLSEGHLGPQVQNNQCGFVLPDRLYGTVIEFQMVKFSDSVKINHDVIRDIEDRPLELEKTTFIAMPNCTLPPFPYIPAAIMIKVGSIFKSSPVWLGWWGRIGSLFAFLAIVYFAIKKLPHFKPALMLIALSPMALYQAASVSYDSLSFAFLFLLFALTIAYYFQEGKITTRQILILFLVAMAQRFSKEGYYLVFFSFAFIPVSKFENKKLYFATFGLMLIAAFLPSQLWSMYLKSLHLPPELPLQKDFLFDLSKNLAFHLKDPFHMIELFVLNILSQGRLWVHGSIGRFGFSYTLLPFALVLTYIAAIIFTVMAEKKEKLMSMRFRFPVLLLVLANCFAIVLIFFLAITPVGGYYIHGMQGRYFTPLLPFLFVFLFYTPVNFIQSDWFRWAVPLFTAIVLLYTINFLDNHFYYSF